MNPKFVFIISEMISHEFRITGSNSGQCFFVGKVQFNLQLSANKIFHIFCADFNVREELINIIFQT